MEIVRITILGMTDSAKQWIILNKAFVKKIGNKDKDDSIVNIIAEDAAGTKD